MYVKDDTIVIHGDQIENMPETLAPLSANMVCPDYPGDTSQRMTLYVNPKTFGRSDGKLCGNWTPLKGNACSGMSPITAVDNNSISLLIRRYCGQIEVYQAEFGLTEAETKVHPLWRGYSCGSGGKVVFVSNSDLI